MILELEKRIDSFLSLPMSILAGIIFIITFFTNSPVYFLYISATLAFCSALLIYFSNRIAQHFGRSVDQ